MKFIDLLESLGVKKLALDTRSVESTEDHTKTDASDNWPTGVPFPSPSDAEISKRAWQRLGLKLLPGTGGHPSLLIYQSRFSKDTDLAPTGIDGTHVGNLEQAAFALRKIADKEQVTIQCSDFRKEGKVDLWFSVIGPGDFTALRRQLSPSMMEAWSKSLGNPSSKEAQIGRLAFDRLGVMLAPAKPDDNYLYEGSNGVRSFVKIIGGNLPGELPGVSLLTRIGDYKVADLDSLQAIFTKLQAEHAPDQIQCTSQAGDKSYLFVAEPIRPETPLGNSAAASDERFKETNPANATADAKAASKQVLAVLSEKWPSNEGVLGTDLDVFRKAYAQGHNKKLRVDLANQDGKMLLVGVPQPTADDWPAMLGESPLKQRVLGEQIWPAFGLKLCCSIRRK